MASLLLIDDAADVFDALRANRKLAEHCAVRELEPVSYTHLDVYKRQVESRARR